MKTKSLVAFVSLACSLSGPLLLLAAPAAAAEFTGLGDLLGGTFRSQAHGVSDDGKVVVGGSFVGSGFSSMTPFRYVRSPTG